MPNQALITTTSELVVRSTVSPGLPYQDYREDLRYDFWFSCAYCTMAEAESMGIRFTTDHYEPKSKRPDLVDDYNNLFWACDLCNDHKGADWPDENMRLRGHRYFRPDQDEPAVHFELTTDLFLSAKTNTGEYTINLIGLNRAELLRLRKLRKRLYDSQDGIARGIRTLRGKSIDLFPPKIRLQVLEERQRLENNTSELDDSLRELNRSILIDADPDKKQRAKSRREYLKKVAVICSE